MTWGKRDDQAWQNEKLIGLSHAAYRLRDVALSFAASEWPTGAGCLSRHRLVALARLHHIENDSLVILELLNLRVLDRCRRDKRGGERFRLHDFAMYMSPVDLSVVRAAAGKRGAIARWSNKSGMAIAMANPSQRDSNGSPVPDPVPVESPNGDSNKESISSAGGGAHENLEELRGLWNGLAVPAGFPRMIARVKPESARGRLMLRLTGRTAFDAEKHDEIQWALAAYTEDAFMLKQHFGIDTFCRHYQRWVDASALSTEQP